MKKLRIIIPIILTVVFVGFSSFTEDGEDGESGIFQHSMLYTVTCGGVQWTQTDFFDINGSLLGSTRIEGGVIKMSFSGSFHSSVTSSGTIGGHPALATQCYGSCFWCYCTRVTAIQACQ